MDKEKLNELNDIELKRCPFCNGRAIFVVNLGFKKEMISAYVYCKECGVSTRHWACRETAIEAWNRRVK